MLKRLSDLKPGDSAIIVKIVGHGAFRKRMLEMGFIRGRKVSVLLDAPLRDPVKYEVMGYEVSLRRSEAELVEVSVDDDETEGIKASASQAPDSESETAKKSPDGNDHDNTIHPIRTINVALIGNPNCGKTSLFNIVSGAREHVGNYSGVTVDAKAGSVRYKNFHINIVDLPGTYSHASN